ncbi:hypothetical protein FQR65_LT05358 [Abscondita terminalis]|nr:hypothetical protein FQR65_LT05358 [Abscondita terminalis]
MSDEISIIGDDTDLGKIFVNGYSAKTYIEVGEDKVVLPEKFRRYWKDISDFEVRDDDVFICVFPKSGSRWTQEMVWLILNNLDYDKALTTAHVERSPLLEVETIIDRTVYERTIKGLATYRSPRCIKSHLQWSLLPKAITSGKKQPKIIVVMRCPEDVCTSQFHQAKVIEGFQGSWDDFCALFLAGKVMYGPYWKHILGYWEQRHRLNMLFLTFTKLKCNLPAVIEEVASFLDKKLSNDQIQELCHHLSFDNLKKSKGYNMEFMVKGEINPFMRKGQIGDHKNMMSEEVVAEFSKQRKQYLEGTNLSFD